VSVIERTVVLSGFAHHNSCHEVIVLDIMENLLSVLQIGCVFRFDKHIPYHTT
jgi:hypothetical protein